MFGTYTFGTEEFAAVAQEITPSVAFGEASTVSAITNAVTGGGWSHRGPIKLPERKTPGFKPVSFKKPNPYRW